MNDLIASLERQNEELDHIISAVESGAITENNPLVDEVMALQNKKIFELLGTKMDPIKKVVPVMLKNDFKKARRDLVPTEPTVTLPSGPIINLPPKPITLSSSNIQNAKKSILIVGGTDGSGTRKVVDILRQLGVLMVSEDPETYDIHADSVAGWPTIVNPILSETKSLNYDISTLTQTLQQSIKEQLHTLINKAAEDSKKPTSYRLAVGGALPRPENKDASNILFGFKAPVAMTLAPLWAHIIPNFRFLHVLRDGRDIAFSANQGPVEKFYHLMYNKDNKGNEEKAITLWSDWNTQIKVWAENYVENLADPEKSFGYFALHSEDLVSPSLPVKFSAISYLAEWVGSTLSEDELCCLALDESVFMGSHDRSSGKGNPKSNLESRYGKWKNILKGNNELSTKMHSMGKDGLSMFGYEPLRELATAASTTKTGYICKVDNVKCMKAKGVADLKEADGFSYHGICHVKIGVDYKGGDIITKDLSAEVNDNGACCRHCKLTPGCTAWTYNKGDFMCYLKNSDVIEIKNRMHLVSGNA